MARKNDVNCHGCPECDEWFHRPYILKNHIARHHGKINTVTLAEVKKSLDQLNAVISKLVS